MKKLSSKDTFRNEEAHPAHRHITRTRTTLSLQMTIRKQPVKRPSNHPALASQLSFFAFVLCRAAPCAHHLRFQNQSISLLCINPPAHTPLWLRRRLLRLRPRQHRPLEALPPHTQEPVADRQKRLLRPRVRAHVHIKVVQHPRQLQLPLAEP